MFSLDPSQLATSATGGGRRPGRWAAVGPMILALVFLVALVLAANNNTVIGWFIAVIALAWLVLATLVYIGVYKAARFGASQISRAQQHLIQQSRQQGTGTRLLDDRLLDDAAPRNGVRDVKLDHSFKIVQVQARIIAEELSGTAAAGLQAPARENIARALETIQTTAHNGRDMLGGDADKDGDDGETISGTVVSN